MNRWLIASDLDGTLLPEGQREVPEELYPIVKRFREKGILFCPASGRSIKALHELFAPIAEDAYFMAENAALIYHGGKRLGCIDIPRPLAREIVDSIAARSDCFARVNTDEGKFFFTEDPEALKFLREMEYPDSMATMDFTKVTGTITQITAITRGDIYGPAKDLLALWQDRIGAAVTGEHWLDFTAAGKGKGLSRICELTGIPLDHTVAFGDCYNDMPMLDIAAYPYIMDNAADDLKERYPNHCRNVLETMLELEKTLFAE